MGNCVLLHRNHRFFLLHISASQRQNQRGDKNDISCAMTMNASYYYYHHHNNGTNKKTIIMITRARTEWRSISLFFSFSLYIHAYTHETREQQNRRGQHNTPIRMPYSSFFLSLSALCCFRVLNLMMYGYIALTRTQAAFIYSILCRLFWYMYTLACMLAIYGPTFGHLSCVLCIVIIHIILF